MKQWALILILGMSINSYGLDLKGNLKVYSGAEIGWWLFNQGNVDGIHLGYGRTDLKLTIPFGLDFQLTHKRFSAGIGSSVVWLFDDEMEFSKYKNFSERDIDIGQRSVHLFNVYAILACKLIEVDRFSISPVVKIGSFKFYSDYIGSDQMKKKLFSEVSLSFKHRIQKVILEVSPVVQIHSADGINRSSNHLIYGFGLQYGIIWEVF